VNVRLSYTCVACSIVDRLKIGLAKSQRERAAYQYRRHRQGLRLLDLDGGQLIGSSRYSPFSVSMLVVSNTMGLGNAAAVEYKKALGLLCQIRPTCDEGAIDIKSSP